MTPDQIKEMFAERRSAEAAALVKLKSIPPEALRTVRDALNDYLEFDEEGVKALIEKALS